MRSSWIACRWTTIIDHWNKTTKLNTFYFSFTFYKTKKGKLYQIWHKNKVNIILEINSSFSLWELSFLFNLIDCEKYFRSYFIFSCNLSDSIKESRNWISGKFVKRIRNIRKKEREWTNPTVIFILMIYLEKEKRICLMLPLQIQFNLKKEKERKKFTFVN